MNHAYGIHSVAVAKVFVSEACLSVSKDWSYGPQCSRIKGVGLDANKVWITSRRKTRCVSIEQVLIPLSSAAQFSTA